MKITELRSLIREAVITQLKEAEMSVKSEALSRLADFFRVPPQSLQKFNFDGNDDMNALNNALNSTSLQGTKMYYKMAIELAKKELGIEESKQLKEYSGDSGLEELADTLGYSDVIEFFEDNAGAVDAVYKWVESIPQLKQQLKQSGMYESSLKEADMTTQYDGFIVFDKKSKKQYKARYMKGINNVKVENNAIAKVMAQSGASRSDLWVNGFIKKGDFDKDTSLTIDSLKEAITVNKSITTQQATKIADKFAKYMSSKENKKFTVTKGSVEGPSFDLDVDGFEYEGGSYIIDTKGDIINVAITNPEVYGNISMLESTIATRMKIKEANKKK
jgi:hypothetical protein